jgi:UDP-GlcNAc:undecaprenyl-phosphate GlcNAc-1-phosphate transferase
MRYANPSAAAVVASFVLSLALTPLVRALARRIGMIARPKLDRWHSRPTALMGGVAIFAAVALVSLAIGPALRTQIFVVLGASSLLFLVGLIDDFFNLKPYQKLIGQFAGVMPVLYCGMVLRWTGSTAVDVTVTVFWLIGITNAVNLLDNMDGLAAGVSAIAAGFLSLNFWMNGQPDNALMLAVLAASLLGFLIYNSQPATIFMGDCGSLFIGFLLASAALLNPASGRSRTFLPVLAVPVLILFIPIFDTLFVMTLRKLAGRPASQGGRDHTSHRLVALGLSERRAVWMLYGFAVASGLLALAVRGLALDVSLAAIVAFSLALAMLGIHLAGVKVYDDGAARPSGGQPLVAFLVDVSYKRRVFEVLLDEILIVLSYYTSYVLVFGPVTGARSQVDFLHTVPVLMSVKSAAFLATGVYRGLWRYVSLENLVVYAKAVVAGSAGSLVVLAALNRFPPSSRVVFALDGLLMLFLLAGSRTAFRILRSVLPPSPGRGGRRALVYGAGDAGEILVRELHNNGRLNFDVVGFVDDDPLKKGRVIHGLPVLGGGGDLPALCKQHRVVDVLVSSDWIPDERIAEVLRNGEDATVVVRRMRFRIESIGWQGAAYAPLSAQ